MKHGLEFSMRRRRKLVWRLLGWLLALAVAAASSPFWWAGLLRLAGRVDQALAARYAARMELLVEENAQLRAELAQNAPAAAENAALRALIDSERFLPDVDRLTPGRVVARWPGGLRLAGLTETVSAGAAVLDRYGRYLGKVTNTGSGWAEVAFAGSAGCPTSGLAGACCGIYADGRLTDLPRSTGLTAGTVVSTPEGEWLGVLAGAPELSPDGLTTGFALTDTADRADYLYLVRR